MNTGRWEKLVRSDLIPIGLCMPAYSTLMFLYFMAFPLGERAYASPSIVSELVTRPGPALLLLAHFAVLGLAWERTGWRALEGFRPLRIFIVFVAGVLAWRFSCLGYNFYFDQAYLFDRAAARRAARVPATTS